MAYVKKTIEKKFWEKVSIEEDCWLWQGTKDNQGYGRFKYEGKIIGAHRATLLLGGGVIPPNKFVCHTCNVSLCVRPAHLYVGDAKTNGRDRAQAKTMCKYGHWYTEENTRWVKETRRCRTCIRMGRQQQ